MKCGYQWEATFYDEGADDDVCEGDHECILDEGHDGEHECFCGDTSEEEGHLWLN